MSNIDNIIADITEVNQTYGFWIRDEDGVVPLPLQLSLL